MTGLYALVGVIVGALVSGAVQLVLERRRETHMIKTAKRLVFAELQKIWAHHVRLLQDELTPELSTEDKAGYMPTHDWLTYRDALASPRALSEDEWIALSAFMTHVELNRSLVLRAPPRSPLPEPDSIDAAREIAATLYRILAGREPRMLV